MVSGVVPEHRSQRTSAAAVSEPKSKTLSPFSATRKPFLGGAPQQFQAALKLRRSDTPTQYRFDSRGRWNPNGVRHQFDDTHDFAAWVGLRDVRVQTRSHFVRRCSRPTQETASSLRAWVTHTNVTSLRRKPFKQKGLATLSQQYHQSTQDSPVYRVDYRSFQGHRPRA